MVLSCLGAVKQVLGPTLLGSQPVSCTCIALVASGQVKPQGAAHTLNNLYSMGSTSLEGQRAIPGSMVPELLLNCQLYRYPFPTPNSPLVT